MMRNVTIATLLAAAIATQQWCVLAALGNPDAVLLLYLIGIPVTFGLPFLAGLLASRGRELAYQRNALIVGSLGGGAGVVASLVPWMSELDTLFPGMPKAQSLAFLLLGGVVILGNEVGLSLAGGTVAVWLKTRKPSSTAHPA